MLIVVWKLTEKESVTCVTFVSSTEVIERLPTLFLGLGGLTSAMQLLGLLLSGTHLVREVSDLHFFTDERESLNQI